MADGELDFLLLEWEVIDKQGEMIHVVVDYIGDVSIWIYIFSLI